MSGENSKTQTGQHIFSELFGFKYFSKILKNQNTKVKSISGFKDNTQGNIKKADGGGKKGDKICNKQTDKNERKYEKLTFIHRICSLMDLFESVHQKEDRRHYQNSSEKTNCSLEITKKSITRMFD